MVSTRPISLLVTLGLVTTLLCGPLAAASVDSPQFRGPARDGHYAETGLLEAWPEDGPSLLWAAKGLGEGYASVSVADGLIFVAGMKDERGTVFAFRLDGTKAWATEYGGEHSGNGYPGTRTTPTYDDGHLYLMSALGNVVALEAKTGKIAWQVDVLERFGGENIYFGMSESPLIDGDHVIVTAGGKDASVVALDRKTGATVWTTKGLSDTSAYCSPRMIEHKGKRQIVTFVARHLVGIDPADGTVLWRHETPVEYDIHANSPLIHGDLIFTTHGYNQGSAAYRLQPDGRGVTPAWKDDKLDANHGATVLVDGHVYGAASKKNWYALHAETGEVKATIKRLGTGTVVYADGLLYGYVESGEVLLVDPNPDHFEVISRFKVKAGDGQHWAHPVLAHGMLLLRHGDVLSAYDVARGE